MEKSVTQYFDEEGYLAQDIIRADALRLLHRFENGGAKKLQ